MCTRERTRESVKKHTDGVLSSRDVRCIGVNAVAPRTYTVWNERPTTAGAARDSLLRGNIYRGLRTCRNRDDRRNVHAIPTRKGDSRYTRDVLCIIQMSHPRSGTLHFRVLAPLPLIPSSISGESSFNYHLPDRLLEVCESPLSEIYAKPRGPCNFSLLTKISSNDFTHVCTKANLLCAIGLSPRFR